MTNYVKTGKPVGFDEFDDKLHQRLPKNKFIESDDESEIDVETVNKVTIQIWQTCIKINHQVVHVLYLSNKIRILEG